jgi:hypothetical protein
MTHARKLLVARLLMIAWLPMVAAGFWGFSSQSFVPSPAGEPPATWPAGLSLEPAAGRYSLVVAIHPECPCSSATLEELSKIMSKTGDRLQTYAIYAGYRDLPQPIVETRNWRRAAGLPHTSRLLDDDGRLTRRFAALTSGEVRLYDPEGGLRFRGGITASRGHAGENPGARAVHDIVLDLCGASTPVATPVFGCPL